MRRRALTLSGPWHSTQFRLRMGITSRVKSTASAWVSTVTGSAATSAFRSGRDRPGRAAGFTGAACDGRAAGGARGRRCRRWWRRSARPGSRAPRGCGRGALVPGQHAGQVVVAVDESASEVPGGADHGSGGEHAGRRTPPSVRNPPRAPRQLSRSQRGHRRGRRNPAHHLMPFQSCRGLTGHRLVPRVQGAQAHRHHGPNHAECQTVCPSFRRHRLAAHGTPRLDDGGRGQQGNREVHDHGVQPAEQQPAPPGTRSGLDRVPASTDCDATRVGCATVRPGCARCVGDGRVGAPRIRCTEGSFARAGAATASRFVRQIQLRHDTSIGCANGHGSSCPRRRAANRVYVVEFRRTTRPPVGTASSASRDRLLAVSDAAHP